MKISEFFLKTTKTGHFPQKLEQKANENLSKQLYNIGLWKNAGATVKLKEPVGQFYLDRLMN